MEQFVRLVVAGGVVLVAGLWFTQVAAQSALWAAGVALALVGTAALAAGIWRELDWRPSS